MENENVAISLCLIIIASAALRIDVTGGGQVDEHLHGYIGEDSLDTAHRAIMSPPVGLGDKLFLPWSSVRLSV